MRAIGIIVLLSAACDSETTTKTFNDNPTIAIMSHSDGFEAVEGPTMMEAINLTAPE